MLVIKKICYYFKITIFAYNRTIFYVRCACHIINLIVQKCLQFFQANLENIRSCLISLNTYASRQQDFKMLCAHYGITFRRFVNDAPHRWNSIYLMLKSSTKFKDVITHYCNINQSFNFQVAENEWLIGCSIYKFSALFCNATYILFGVYYPTSPLPLTEINNMSHLFSKYRNAHGFYYVVSKWKQNV